MFLVDPVPVSFGFPIEAFGNDGIQEVWKKLYAVRCGKLNPQKL